MDKFLEMGTEKTSKLLFKYSLPAITGMLVLSLYNIIDRIFVGQTVGTNGTATLTVAFPVMMISYAAAVLVNTGASSYIARLLGLNDTKGAEKSLAQSFVIGIVLSIVTNVLCFLILDPLLYLFGASEFTLDNARIFSIIILVASPFQTASMALNAGIRSQGKSKSAMMMLFSGAFLNILFCFIFVILLQLGVVGSALATFVSQILSLGISLLFFLTKRGVLKLKIKNMLPDISILKEIINVGFSAWIMNIIPVGLFLILNNEMKGYKGDTGIAMIGIVIIISSIVSLPVFGIMQGVGPIISYNYTAQKYKRVLQVCIQAFLSSTLLFVVFWLLIEIFPWFFVTAFESKDKDLIKIGIQGLTIYLFATPFIGLPIILTQYYQSIGKPIKSSILAMSRQIIFLVPALIILPIFFGYEGILYSGPISDLLGTLMAIVFLIFEIPTIRKNIKS